MGSFKERKDQDSCDLDYRAKSHDEANAQITLTEDDKIIVPLDEISMKELKVYFTKMMEEQPILMKHPQSSSRHGRKHERVIIINLEEGTLIWKSKKMDEKVNGFIRLQDINQIERGLVTVRMVRNINESHAGRCFSVFTDNRELNFEAENEKLCNLWVQGLKTVVNSLNKDVTGSNNNCLLM